MPGKPFTVDEFLEYVIPVLGNLQDHVEKHRTQKALNSWFVLMAVIGVAVPNAATRPGFQAWHKKLSNYVQSHHMLHGVTPQEVEALADEARAL